MQRVANGEYFGTGTLSGFDGATLDVALVTSSGAVFVPMPWTPAPGITGPASNLSVVSQLAAVTVLFSGLGVAVFLLRQRSRAPLQLS